MKVVLAFDSFKGSLSADDACRVAAEALQERLPGLEVVRAPMADGGEGTAAALLAAGGGEWVPARVTGPRIGMRVDAGFAWFAAKREALVEMAAASGLTLLAPEERNPLLTTTYGTGELVRQAAARGAARVLLAVGGSATVDGGAGAAAALGWRFLDSRGRTLDPVGGTLLNVRTIRPPPARVWPDIRVLCDVDNPLCGEDGAACVFGPQKGATADTVGRLDAGLAHMASLARQQLGRDVARVPGAGAAGGLAAGAVAFLGAEIESGVAAVMDRCSLRTSLGGASWVLTGEGKFDEQTCRGKVVSGVCRLAREAGAGIAVFAGEVRVPEPAWRAMGVRAAYGLREPGMRVEDSVARAADLLRRRVAEFAASLASSQARSPCCREAERTPGGCNLSAPHLC
jgi:glycerate kinase